MSGNPLLPRRSKQTVRNGTGERASLLAPAVTPELTYMRRLLAAKLGRCSFCMRAALQGAVVTWLLVLAVALLPLQPALTTVTLIAALSFSGLVVAHAVAYVWRATPAVPTAPCCGRRQALQPVPHEVQHLHRRTTLRAVLSLPAAFGLAQLAWAPPAAAKPLSVTTVTKTFRKTLPCQPCAGDCTFEAFFEYDHEPPTDGKIQVTRFRMTWNQGGTVDCQPSIDRGMGAFDFQCVGDKKECKLTGGNIWKCPCDTRVEFVPLGDSTAEDCVCPNQKNRVAFAQDVCGAPIAVEKTCDFEWINIDFRHKVTCTCATGGITRGDLVVVAKYQNGVITFGGDVVS